MLFFYDNLLRISPDDDRKHMQGTAMLRHATAAFAPSGIALRMSSAALPRTSPRPLPRVLVLAGPTGVGKSSAALSLAERINGEIISADSVQVFRGLDVGSNKSSLADRARVPHHLLDVADPATDDYSAGDFFRAARAAADDILSRGSTPIVVGGTMMYLRWFVRGRPATPRASDAVRARVDQLVSQVAGDWPAGLELLRARDPKRAGELSRNDWYRLQRALQVAEADAPISELPQTGASPKCGNEPVVDAPYDFRCVFLFDERVTLNRSIDRRCEEMILPPGMVSPPSADALLETKSVVAEVGRLLLARGLRVAGTAPSRAIGYRQTIAYLVSRALASDTATTDEAAVAAFRKFVDDFQQATRNYAKQQLAWFRKEPFFRWVRAGETAPAVMESLLALNAIEYGMLEGVTKDAQRSVREDVVAQGKLMRTYVAEKCVLVDGSRAERVAVSVGERIAGRLAAGVPRGELSEILERVLK